MNLVSDEELAFLKRDGLHTETVAKSVIHGVILVTYRVYGQERNHTLSVPDWRSSTGKALQLHFQGFWEAAEYEEVVEPSFSVASEVGLAQQLELAV